MNTPVTVVGAGLGGLVLARVLQLHHVPVVVYEADPSPAARRQGGMLDLHPWNGQRALEAAGLLEPFRGIVLEGRESYRVLDPSGRLLLDRPDDGTGVRPEVQRGELRQLLLDSLPEGVVRWGCKVSSVTPLGGGRHQVRFADDTTVTTDLLVGADGAWSKVRPLVSAARPSYVGVTVVETFLHSAAVRHPEEALTVGAGSVFALAPGRGILSSHEADGTLHTYAQLLKPADWLADADPAMVRAAVASEFESWAPGLTALLTASDTEPSLRRIYSLPDGHRWDRTPATCGVTLLGDAAHLMPPNGEGANLAMLDAAELALSLVRHPDDVDDALGTFEEAMFARAAEVAGAEDVYELMLGPDSPRSWLEMMGGAA